jgi:hypothetical protein
MAPKVDAHDFLRKNRAALIRPEKRHRDREKRTRKADAIKWSRFSTAC